MRVENISFTVGFSKEVANAAKFYAVQCNRNFDDIIKELGYWAIGLLNDETAIKDGAAVFTYYEDPFYIWYDLSKQLIRISFDKPHGPKGKIERNIERATRTAMNPGQEQRSSRKRGKVKQRKFKA